MVDPKWIPTPNQFVTVCCCCLIEMLLRTGRGFLFPYNALSEGIALFCENKMKGLTSCSWQQQQEEKQYKMKGRFSLHGSNGPTPIWHPDIYLPFSLSPTSAGILRAYLALPLPFSSSPSSNLPLPHCIAALHHRFLSMGYFPGFATW